MGNFKRNRTRFFAWIYLAVLLAGSFCIKVSAAETTYSIFVVCRGLEDDEIVYLTGDTYALVQIAEGQVNGEDVQFTTLPRFAAFDCAWGELTDSQSQKKAKALETVVKQQELYERTGITDEDGAVVFDGLEPGVYLLMRIEIAEGNDDFLCDPILYNVPTFVNHHVVQRLVATPKMVWLRAGDRPLPGDPDYPNNDPTAPPEDSQNDTLPQTGQLNWPIPILMLTGMGFFFAGFTLQYGGAWEDEE